MSNFDKTLEALIQHTYDSGYYSGKHEDGQPQHKEAILQRAYAKAELEMRVKKLVGACHCAPLATIAHLMDIEGGGGNRIRRILEALLPFEEDDHGP